MIDKLNKDIAYNIGVEAFKNGKKRIPSCDNQLSEKCLKNCKVGEGILHILSWLNGWDDANSESIDPILRSLY